MNENKADKNEHENGKRSKAGAGEAKYQKKAQNYIRSPQRFRNLQEKSLVKI